MQDHNIFVHKTINKQFRYIIMKKSKIVNKMNKLSDECEIYRSAHLKK